MKPPPVDLNLLQQANAATAFHAWTGLEVSLAEPGRVELRLPWRGELAQYRGFLHAGMIAALLDTASGYAAATLAGAVMTSHFSVSCLRPGVGESFRAVARVVRAGARQIFCQAELHALRDGQEQLIATGEALLLRTEAPAA